MIWAFIKRLPKLALVFGLIIGSTIAFGVWWFTHGIKKAIYEGHAVPAEDIGPKLALVASKPERLLLVDNDLYDLDTGALIFKGWLKAGMPAKLFWEADSKTVLAQYELGFVRYGLDGAEQASFKLKYPFGIADDDKWVVFAKDKDIWRADVDWKTLKLVNERKLTSLGQFNDVNFAGNIILGTDKTLIVRNMNQLLRVDLESGAIHPTKIPLLEIGKRRSPDSKSVVGIQNGQFYCYDVDTDDAKAIQVGRGAINDYQWLGNDRCVAIAAMKSVILYDRKKNALTELAALPSQCNKIGEPSPDGRFVFCYSFEGGDLLDVVKKTATPINGGAGIAWVSNDTYALSRDVPDTDLRGVWLEKAGEGERRVSPEPYLVNRRGDGFIMPIPKAGVVVFATKNGLSRMKPDGSEVAEVVKLAHAPERVLGIQDWKQ
jgi:hypothetical protein